MKTLNWNNNELIPAIIQDSHSGQVLMLGYMNESSFNLTLNSGFVTFFSRSKKRLWQKGETSGNVLRLTSYSIDCDSDAILIQVIAEGPTCHSGNQSCFDSPTSSLSVFSQLEKRLIDRKRTLPKNSYSSQLFSEGNSAITKKIVEEAAEVMMASQKESDQRLIEEVTDLFFHTLTLLIAHDLSLTNISDELKRRMQ